MIITDDFVFVHDPKTGGSFVTAALYEMHGIKWSRWMNVKLAIRGVLRHRTKFGEFVHTNQKHSGCRFIPEHLRGRKILAAVRNPLDWYVSQYEFGWWKRREMRKYFQRLPDFRRAYPLFPEISFAEFVELSNRAFETHLDCPGEIWSQFGLRTRAFADFYFKHPGRAIEKMLDEGYIFSGAYRSELYENLHFIHTKSLNRNLYDFLACLGYKEADIAFILEMKKVLPLGKGRTKEQKWEKYYTPELEARIRHEERILFRMFPEFGA